MTPGANKQGATVSFIRNKVENNSDEDEVEISQTPYFQTAADDAESERYVGCCGITFPIPFERAAPSSWWNPKFENERLEEQYKSSSFPQIRLRFRYGLIYILLVSVSWLTYFVIHGIENHNELWPIMAVVFAIVTLFVISILYFTHSWRYAEYVSQVSVGTALMLCTSSILLLIFVPPYTSGLTLVGHFTLCAEILLLIYTVIPMPLYLCVLICSMYSITFEFLTAYLYSGENLRNEYQDLQPSLPSKMLPLKSNGIAHRLIRDLNISSLILNRTVSQIPSVLPIVISDVQKNMQIMNASSSQNSSQFIADAYNSDDIDLATCLTIRFLAQMCIHLIGIHILIMTFVRMRGTFMKVGQSLLVRRQLEMEKQLKEKIILSVMPLKVATWLIEESEREREREDSLKKNSIPSNNSDIRSLFRPFNMHCMDDVSILFADIVGFTKMSSNKTAEELVGILNDLFEIFDHICVEMNCEKISTLGDCYYCVSGCPEPRPDHAKSCVNMGLSMIEAIKVFDDERKEGVNMRVGVHTGRVLCGIVGTTRFKFDVWSNDVTFANKMESTGEPGRVHISEKTRSFLPDQYVTEEGETINGMKTFFIKYVKMDFPLKRFPRNLRASYKNWSSPSTKRHYLQLVTDVSSHHKKANSLPSILDTDKDTNITSTSVRNEVDDKSPCDKKSPFSSTNSKKRRTMPWKSLRRQHTTEAMMPVEKFDNELDNVIKNIVIMPEVAQGLLENLPSPDIESDELETSSLHNSVEMDPNPVSSSPLLQQDEEIRSRASSMGSKKDLANPNFRRRNSIQHQLFLINGMTKRDSWGPKNSDYFTSNSTLDSNEFSNQPSPVLPTFGFCFYNVRKPTDFQLIKCIQDYVTSNRSYFIKPPLSSLTLFFKSEDLEKEYRANAHKVTTEVEGCPPTLATSRFNTYFDILISVLVYIAVTTSLFLLCELSTQYIIFFGLATFIKIVVVSLCIQQWLNPNVRHGSFTTAVFKFFCKWYPWHIFGAFLVGLPIICILLNLTYDEFSLKHYHAEDFHSYLTIVGLVHFCNFTQLNCWMKNILVTLAGILYIFVAVNHFSFQSQYGVVTLLPNISKELTIGDRNNSIGGQTLFKMPFMDFNHTEFNNYTISQEFDLTTHSLIKNSSILSSNVNYSNRLFNYEIFIDISLLLLLVWFLNREFEISYRLSFHCNSVAARDKTRVESMKNQADWLLHNIIPKYVADQLKTTAKYSQNHENVGIIFASIVNFNELYDESYLKGKEYLRVLNELIADFDELLENPEYSNVEKIKTIGSTFMAASGLNPLVRQQNEHEYTHIHQLLDFAKAMHQVISDFNQDLLGFQLILRVGFNYGDVTAGVIGATKLYYDIWGDAVNVASRMDSTGMPGEIQFASNCLEIVNQRYSYKARGQVFVKGKGDMDVFLLGDQIS